jgi:hypothetical protein
MTLVDKPATHVPVDVLGRSGGAGHSIVGPALLLAPRFQQQRLAGVVALSAWSGRRCSCGQTFHSYVGPTML